MHKNHPVEAHSWHRIADRSTGPSTQRSAWGKSQGGRRRYLWDLAERRGTCSCDTRWHRRLCNVCCTLQTRVRLCKRAIYQHRHQRFSCKNWSDSCCTHSRTSKWRTGLSTLTKSEVTRQTELTQASARSQIHSWRARGAHRCRVACHTGRSASYMRTIR